MTTNSTWWHCETSVGISPEAAESMVRNKIPETLLPVSCCGDSARETTIAAGEASVGQLFPIFRDYNSLRSQCARVSDRVSSEFPVCSICFSNSGVDAGRGLESIAPQFV
jgi:hypothetical protein